MSERAAGFYRKLKILWDGVDSADDETSRTAAAFLDALGGAGSDEYLAEPFNKAVSVLHAEFDNLLESDRRKALENLEKLIGEDFSAVEESGLTLARTLWAVFFPEALYLSADPEEQITLLRKKRIVRIEKTVSDPVVSPAEEILFTSNVLLSPPVSDSAGVDSSGVFQGEEIAGVVAAAAEAGQEKQLYWYDHPIPIGTALENDEAVYGLAGLSAAMAVEKERGHTEAGAKLQVLLSVSVTHPGLHEWALPWLRAQLKQADGSSLENLDVFAFTENDTEKIIDILTPWLGHPDEAAALKAAFGVDGEYGRHYSFLKALPALWSVLIDPVIKATFKIDLDQVFPQKELVAETGKSAFEHFRTPLWGAVGTDSGGRDIELGMIAGALVNEKDIESGVFTPDIPWPEELPAGEDLLFYKLLPMAVSTRAELMTRYENVGDESPDGVTSALHRIHVTGGTNGIRLDALRRYKPFTPSFIGRAEDQGYLLSVLNGTEGEPLLRYFHASGLVMRHDKEAFAGAAVKAGKAGSYVGDLIRLFVFSHYAGFLPGGQQSVKSQTDPFTGCFISPLPATLSLLRLALHLLDSRGSSGEDRKALLELAGLRLPEWVKNREEKAAELKKQWFSERKAWNSYYNALDRIETALADGDPSASETALRFKDIIESCRIT